MKSARVPDLPPGFNPGSVVTVSTSSAGVTCSSCCNSDVFWLKPPLAGRALPTAGQGEAPNPGGGPPPWAGRHSRLAWVLALLTLPGAPQAWALDSYRYLHVTIQTPWSIFLFLLIGIFAPFVLMGVLAWHFSSRRRADVPKPPPESGDHA